MKSKRILAYIIDAVLLFLVLLILTCIFNTDNLKTLNTEMQSLQQAFLSKEVSFSAFLNHYSSIAYDIDRQRSLVTFIGIVLMILYFVFLPYKCSGQTLGKKIMKIQIVKEGIGFKDYFMRGFIINGLGFALLSFLLVMILPSFSYFLTISILGFLQVTLVLTSLFMILYKKDNKDLEDLLTGTSVVPLNEVKK